MVGQNKLNWETAQLIQLSYPLLQRLTAFGHLLPSPRAEGSPESVLTSGALPTDHCRLWVGFAVFLLYRHTLFYWALLCCALQMLSINWRQGPPPAKKTTALLQYLLCCAGLGLSLQYHWGAPVYAFLVLFMQVLWDPHVEINYYDELEKSPVLFLAFKPEKYVIETVSIFDWSKSWSKEEKSNFPECYRALFGI